LFIDIDYSATPLMASGWIVAIVSLASAAGMA